MVLITECVLQKESLSSSPDFDANSMKATCSSPEEIVELHNQTKEKWPGRCWGDKDLAAKSGIIHFHLSSQVRDEIIGSLEFVRGSTIDFTDEMIRSSFVVANNPNSESACGCGSSFALKQ